jgi:mono/diheme cytochrome c family protein
MNRTPYGFLLAAATILAATTISAGGWAVITVDDVPEYARAGEPITLAYSVRQHGKHLLGGLHGRVEATAGSRRVIAEAGRGKYDGHYVAALTLPSAGDWSLTIQSGFPGLGTLALLPLRAMEGSARPPALGPSDRGQQVFVAKGCATCHYVDGKALPPATLQGPALVPHKYQSEYLARVLANPALLPPSPSYAFRMPNLGLNAREIEAVVAFINPPPSHANSAARK